MKNSGDLLNALISAGHPIEGCAIKKTKTGVEVGLTFKPGTSKTKQNAAKAFADSYNWDDGTTEQKQKDDEQETIKSKIKDGTADHSDVLKFLAEGL